MTQELAKQNSNEMPMVGAKPFYTSINIENQEDALKLYDNVSNAEALSDHLNETIFVQDIILQPVDMADAETGEITSMVRSVLVTEDGNAYAASSTGVETSLRNLFATVGEPPYIPAIPIKAKSVQGRHGYKFTTLSVDFDALKKRK